jgi:hypothetical protein
LVFLDIINAKEMNGPVSAGEWRGATRLIHAFLGLPASMEAFGIYHAYIDVEELIDLA